MATTQSIRRLVNYQAVNEGNVPYFHIPTVFIRTPLERYGESIRYATNLVQYYKENYQYHKVQDERSSATKNSGVFNIS